MNKLGPGLLFAASAVGVSHLVQSTRAGAEFGFTMACLILLVCLVKYPAFRFGAEYAAATGESVIAAYARQGRWLLGFFIVAIAVEGLVVIPAVSLVAAGMALNLIGIDANEIMVSMAIVGLTSLVLALGRYRVLESVSKVFVVLFALLAVIAAGAVAMQIGDGRGLAAPMALTRDNLFFSVAVAGWMPVGMGGSVFLSLWVVARSELQGRPVTIEEARFDFNLAYIGTVVLALCFLLMGTVLLLGSGIDLSANAAAFATQLVSLFVQSVGAWIEPVIGVAALAVMFSTVLTVVDGFPRVYANVLRRLGATVNHDAASSHRLYVIFLLIQAVVALGLLLYFLERFGAFIDFATTAGFLTAPVIAFLNHRVICSDAVAQTDRPAPWLRYWSVAGVVILGGVSLLYLLFRFA